MKQTGVSQARAQVANEPHESHLRKDHHSKRHVGPRVLGDSLLLIQNPLSGRLRNCGTLTHHRAANVGQYDVGRTAKRSDSVDGIMSRPPASQPLNKKGDVAGGHIPSSAD